MSTTTPSRSTSRTRVRSPPPGASCAASQRPASTSSAPWPDCTTVTSRATSSLSRWKATQSWLTIGSLIAAIAASTAGRIRAGSTRIRRWSVPKCRATWSDHTNSSPDYSLRTPARIVRGAGTIAWKLM